MDSDARGLKLTLFVLLALSIGRWLALPPESAVDAGSPVDLGNLIDSSRTELTETEARSAPLGAGERIDPNLASEIALDRLPGVGPTTARRIISERESGGRFHSVADLTRVKGIGAATLAKMEPHLEIRSRRNEASSAATAAAPETAAPETLGRIDVNRVSRGELESLPGIGPALAMRILEARTELLFASVEDLGRVKGIGPATVERLRPLVAVGRQDHRR